MARGYQSYHGRTPGWKKGLVIVLVLILIAAGGFLLLQPKFVFDEDGSHLKGPDSSTQEQEDNKDVDDEDLVIDVQEPEPKPVSAELLGKTVELSFLADENAAPLEEGQRPVVVMKAGNGTALTEGIAPENAEKIRKKAEETGAVARISCFKDTEYADANAALAVMSVSGRAWRDPDGNTWLDPYNPDVTAYLVNIVKACADLGFREIVLDDVQFPNYGVLSRVTYGEKEDTPETRAAAINAFVKAVADAASAADVQVGISLPRTVLESQKDDTAGWQLASLLPLVDRVYMDAASQEEADAARTALTALHEGADAKLFFVAQSAAPITGGSYVIG